MPFPMDLARKLAPIVVNGGIVEARTMARPGAWQLVSAPGQGVHL